MRQQNLKENIFLERNLFNIKSGNKYKCMERNIQLLVREIQNIGL